jgi:Flp pilus assembly protein TadD
VSGPARPARQRLALAGIVLLALGLRLAYFAQVRSSPFFDHPVYDPRDYLAWAREIASGNLVWDGPRLYPPGYPYFLAGLVLLTGGDVFAMTFANALLGCAWIVLLVLALRRMLPPPVPEVAGVLAATYAPFLHFEAHLLAETLYILLAVLALFLLSRGSARAGALLASGLALGLAAVTRPNAAAVVPCVVLLLAARRAAARSLFLLAGFAAVVAPVVVRTHEVTGLWALRHHNWLNVWVGNRPDAPGCHDVRPGRAWDRLSAEPAREGAGPTLADHERYFRDRVVRFVRERPGDLVALQLRKLELFFHAREIRVILAPAFFERYAPLQAALPGFGAVGPLILVGLGLAVASPGRPWLLLAFAVPQLLSVVLTVMGSRYRLPVLPFLIPFAATAATALGVRLRERRWAGAAALGAGLAVSAWIVNRELPLAIDESFAEELSRVAIVRREQGDIAGAFAAWDEALRENPGRAETWAGYAELAVNAGDVVRAEAVTRAALRVPAAAADPDLRSLRGRALLLLGAPDSAVANLEASLATRPDDVDTLADLGRALADRGDRDAAAAALRRALELDPSRRDVRLDLEQVVGP